MGNTELIDRAKELYLTPGEDGKSRYCLYDIVQIIGQEYQGKREVFTLPVLRSLTRTLKDGDKYTWDELRSMAVNYGMKPSDKGGSTTWEEAILDRKHQLEVLGFNTMLSLNIQASQFLGKIKLDGAEEFTPFDVIKEALEVYTITKQHIDRSNKGGSS